jgi:N-methylhydantoinase B
MSISPFTVEVVRNAFDSIASQMNFNLARSAYSPTIYEMHDCSVGVFDAQARLLGESAGLPIFLGNLKAVIDATTEHFGGYDVYRPGDVYMVNDSYITGSHLNDVTVFAPFFSGGELIGFGATKAHWADIGSKDPGEVMDSTDIYQEGYRLGPTHLYVAGEPARETLDFLLRNSRMPKAVAGDMQAQITACRSGERQLAALHRKFGSDVVSEAAEAVFAQCERIDRETVTALPDGVYRAAGRLDSYAPGGEPVPVQVEVRIEGDRLTVDLTGSSMRTPGPVNCGLAQTISGARLAYRMLVNPDAPISDGTFRNLQVVTEPGSIFDAREPAACQYYYPHIGLMIDLIIRALAPVVPDVAIGGQTADAENVILSGFDPRTGRRFVSGEATAVGWGAHAGGPGGSAMVNYGGGDLKNFPVEVLEARYPVRIHRYGLRRGSGGAGRHRGGDGVVREYEVLADVDVSLWFERTLDPGWGIFGGEAGQPTSVTVDTGDGPVPMLKVNRMALPKGSRLLVQTGGGGGYGDPLGVAR